MKARGWWVVMLVMALLVVVPRAMAQRPPETHPLNVDRNIVMTWDRSAVPDEIELQAPRTLLAYDYVNAALEYGALHLVCGSKSDSRNGLCPTDEDSSWLAGVHDIRLEFLERRSGMRMEIVVRGAIQRAMSGRSCLGDFWQNALYAPWSSYGVACASDVPAGTGLQLSIPKSELQKLVAGSWNATLNLDVQTPSVSRLARHTYTIALTITDQDAVSIYFPQYESASPLVNLDARFDPISQTVGGRVKMDMCLYDGLGSQAAYLGVTARDNGTRTPGPTGFSLWHPAAGTDDSQRLDYTVTIEHNGAPFSMASGVEQQLTGIDSANLRQVVLPGMSQAVYCVPTPMTLEIPRVPVASKQSGTYWGDLVIELRVPTATP